jgi:hypothetical protein
MDERPQAATNNSESAHQSEPKVLSQVVGTMKQEIEDEAKRLTSAPPMGKPQGMTEACSVMKEEIYGNSLNSPTTADVAEEDRERVEPSPAERKHKKL